MLKRRKQWNNKSKQWEYYPLDPSTGPRSIAAIILFGYGLWLRIFKKKTPVVLGAGFVGGIIAAIILNYKT
jgi:hypothetical protein